MPAQHYFRVAVPAPGGMNYVLLSSRLDHLQAQLTARSFRQQQTPAEILPDTRTLRETERRAEELGVVIFDVELVIHCPCGCGQQRPVISFRPRLGAGAKIEIIGVESVSPEIAPPASLVAQVIAESVATQLRPIDDLETPPRPRDVAAPPQGWLTRITAGLAKLLGLLF